MVPLCCQADITIIQNDLFTCRSVKALLFSHIVCVTVKYDRYAFLYVESTLYWKFFNSSFSDGLCFLPNGKSLQIVQSKNCKFSGVEEILQWFFVYKDIFPCSGFAENVFLARRRRAAVLLVIWQRTFIIGDLC